MAVQLKDSNDDDTFMVTLGISQSKIGSWKDRGEFLGFRSRVWEG